ncbi:MAG TPA: hypothetical protein VG389_16140 [Myxococcota bacterium]|jgi:hypothetical protein|nr:hypothetical protein [Myxococcota bacterium]
MHDEVAKTPKTEAARYAEARDSVRRLLDAARPAYPAGAPVKATVASGGKLVAALDVTLSTAGPEGTPWVTYEILVYLHACERARARVVLLDGQTDEILRAADEDVTSSGPLRLAGMFPLTGDCELWCEARLVDAPDTVATAFAWIVPPGGEWRARRANAAVPGRGERGAR